MEQIDTMKKQWVKVYPTYIDKALKHSEGRKIACDIAVENPTTKEIFAICAEELRLDCKQEIKHHPKDWLKRGRVIVGLKYDGQTVNKEIKTKNDLLKYIAKALSQIRSQTKVELVDDAEGKKRRTKKKK